MRVISKVVNPHKVSNGVDAGGNKLVLSVLIHEWVYHRKDPAVPG